MPTIDDLAKLGLPLAVIGAIVAVVKILFFNKPKILLDKTRKRAQVLDVHQISHDTKRIRLSCGGSKAILGLPVGKHFSVFAPNPQKCIDSKKWNGKDDPDRGVKEIKRSYTPVTGNETKGYVDLVIKVYRPGTVKMPDGREVVWEDGGKMSLYFDSLSVGDSVEVTGPVGHIEYLGKGSFKVPGKTISSKHVGMMAGGTGITPALQVVTAALRDKSDTTQFTLLYANKTEDDILIKDLLEDTQQQSGGRFKVHYTLDFPPEGWKGQKGFITADMIKECLPPVSSDPVILMCGPPPMVEHACKKNLEALGYPKGTYFAW